MLNHVFFTWFLANLLHPLMWILWVITMGSNSFRSAAEIGALFFLTIACLIFSLPCLLISHILLKVIAKAGLTVDGKFCLWLITPLILISVEILIVTGFPHMSFDLRNLYFAIPALVATAFITLLRYEQFTKLFDVPQTGNYE